MARHLRYSHDITDLREASIFIVTVPTPVDQANRPDMTPLMRASEMVGGVLKDGDIVIYESTVYPGATEEICVPILEKLSGKNSTNIFSVVIALSASTLVTKSTVCPPSKRSPAVAQPP